MAARLKFHRSLNASVMRRGVEWLTGRGKGRMRTEGSSCIPVVRPTAARRYVYFVCSRRPLSPQRTLQYCKKICDVLINSNISPTQKPLANQNGLVSDAVHIVSVSFLSVILRATSYGIPHLSMNRI